LVFPRETEFIAYVTQKRNPVLGEDAIKRYIASIGWVEGLSVGKDFDERCPFLQAALQLLDRVPALRINRDSREETPRMAL
jgi:hypothetical protein